MKSKKISIDRFPHVANLRNNGKVKVLRKKYGELEGYAFWCMMLEILIDSPTLEWNFNPVQIEVFADELGIEEVKLQAMIETAISLEMLSEDEEGLISCQSLNDKVKYEKRKPTVFKEQAPKFVAPELIDVVSYFQYKHNCSEAAALDFAEKFWNHYNSKGWTVGKAPMKSWKSAVDGTWKETGLKSIAAYPNNQAPIQQRTYLNV